MFFINEKCRCNVMSLARCFFAAGSAARYLLGPNTNPIASAKLFGSGL
jgi:hypothetical protein